MDRDGPARPTFRQLQYFVAVAEHRSFGKAASALAVSQPSLSKQLATMEEELGVALIERTSRRVTLTAAGERLLPRARTILSEIREFRASARNVGGLFGDRLSIGVLPSIGAYFMPSVNRLLHRLYPGLRLFVEEGSTTALLDMLREGRLDVVIGAPTGDPTFTSFALFAESLWVCAAAEDPLSASTGPVSAGELAGRPLLSLSPEFRLSEIVERLAAAAGTYVSRDYQGSSLDAVRQMAVMGAGIAVLPSLYALAEAVRDPDFLVRRVDHPEAFHEIALIWRRSAPMQEDCRRLAEHLLAVKTAIREARPERFR